MVPHYTDGIRSVDWFVRYNDGHIGRSVYYPEYQDSYERLYKQFYIAMTRKNI